MADRSFPSQRSRPRLPPMRALLSQVGWVLYLGALVGLLDGVNLRRHGILITIADVPSLVLVYDLGFLALALPVIAAGAVARALATRGAARDTAALRFVARISTTAPAFFALFAFAVGTARMSLPPALLAPIALATYAALALAAVVGAIAWAYRPSRRWVDRGLAVAAFAVTLALALWPRGASTPDSARTARVGASTPNIFLVLIDTLRADHLGVYGYDRPTSPRIDEFAATSVVFDRAYSTSNWTRPSVASLFTSTMPSEHGVVDYDTAVGVELPLLTEVLHAGGYQTAFFTRGLNIEPSDGYWRGADHYYTASGPRRAVARTSFGSHVLGAAPWLVPWITAPKADGRPGDDPERIVRHALGWLEAAEPERPVFAYFHFMGPHNPYLPPAPYDRSMSPGGTVERLADPPPRWSGRTSISAEERVQMIAQYDGEILQHDDYFGRLLDGLRRLERLDDAVVVLLADHGESFGSHGVWGHSSSLFDAVARVPFVIWRSDDASAHGRRIAAPVSLLDVAPTLVELAGAASPPSFDGRSLVPWLRGDLPPYSVVYAENPPHDEVGMWTEEWAYFEGKARDASGRWYQGQWLYRIDDRHQTEELSARHPEVVAEIRSQLADQQQIADADVAAPGAKIELDAERREQLRALGYLDEEP